MNQRTQWIILSVLLAALAVVAFVMLRPGSPPARNSAASAARSNDPPAPGSPVAEVPGAKLSDASPTVVEISELGAWFSSKDQASLVVVRPNFPVLGLDQKAPVTVKEPPAMAKPTKPPTLQGIICVGKAAMALFQGEAYRAGEKIRGSAYHVVGVSRDSVGLKSDDGREVTINCNE